MHRLLGAAEFVGYGRFRGRLYDLGSYPAAIRTSDENETVHGELYFLPEPEEILAALDRYEGCTPDDPAPHEYVRVAVDIQLESGEPTVISAQAYLYNRPTENLTRVQQGDYLAWRARFYGHRAGGPEKRTPPADSTTVSA